MTVESVESKFKCRLNSSRWVLFGWSIEGLCRILKMLELLMSIFCFNKIVLELSARVSIVTTSMTRCAIDVAGLVDAAAPCPRDVI